VTPRQLLRLYPRQWRRRYGDEFLAMMEGATIDGHVVRDVIRAAAGEWIFETLTGRILLGVLVTAIASVAARYLLGEIPSPPDVELLPDGHKLISPPWPVSLGVVFAFLQLLFLLRSTVGFFPTRLTRMSRRELVLWIVALGLASVGSQWGELLLWDGTGIAADSAFEIWQKSALQLATTLMMNSMFASMFNPRYEPRLPQRPAGPALRPLGL
jgi:hypothetical protein